MHPGKSTDDAQVLAYYDWCEGTCHSYRSTGRTAEVGAARPRRARAALLALTSTSRLIAWS
jgi:hypothetical protein